MSKLYDEAFYLEQNERSYNSAKVALSLFRDLHPVNTLVDIGCGVGSWARAALDLGFHEVLAVDGNFVDTRLLVVPQQMFHRQNLAQSFDLGKRFDVAVSMEVAEHIDPCDADTFVSNLSNFSDLILFSAAVPGQGGVHHVNEQPQSYWIEKFSLQGFDCSLELRNRMWNEDSVCGYYRQNVLVFHRNSPVKGLCTQSCISDVIHPAVFAGEKIYQSHVRSSVKQSFRVFVNSVIRKLNKE